MNSKLFCELIMKAVKEKWGYVWGLEGETYTKEMAEKFKRNKRTPPSGNSISTYWTKRCSRWFERRCADCSGLIVWALREMGIFSKKDDYSSGGFINACKKRGKVASGVPKVNGIVLWRKGHIAVWIDGQVAEAKGTDIGVVYGKSSVSSFTDWGYLPWITYDESTTDGLKITQCTGNGVNIRQEATTKSASLGKLYKGDPIKVQSTHGDWHEITTIIKGKTIIGYVYKDYIQQ